MLPLGQKIHVGWDGEDLPEPCDELPFLHRAKAQPANQGLEEGLTRTLLCPGPQSDGVVTQSIGRWQNDAGAGHHPAGRWFVWINHMVRSSSCSAQRGGDLFRGESKATPDSLSLSPVALNASQRTQQELLRVDLEGRALVC